MGNQERLLHVFLEENVVVASVATFLSEKVSGRKYITNGEVAIDHKDDNQIIMFDWMALLMCFSTKIFSLCLLS